MSLMKKFMKIFVPVAAAAMALGSCAKENRAPSAAEAVRISVVASPEAAVQASPAPSSKTYIGTLEGVENSIIWGKGEYMNLYVTAGGSTVSAKSSDEAADLWDGEGQAMFTFDIAPGQAESYLYQGIYPFSAVVAGDDNNKPDNLKVNLPSIQSPAATSYDPAAYIMVAYPQTFTQLETDWTAYFRRATALNKWTLSGISGEVRAVDITVPEETWLAGRRYIDLSTGESGEIYSGGNRTNKIELKYSEPISGSSIDIWFCTWDATVPAGGKVTIEVKTADKKYTREITAKEGGIQFKERCLNTLRVDMSSASQEDIETFAGKYLVAGLKNSEWYIMDPAHSSVYPAVATGVKVAAEAVSFEDFAAVENIGDYVWELIDNESVYALKSLSTGKYVGYYGSGNDASSEDAVNDKTRLSVNYNAATKVAELASLNVAGRHLVFNSSSPRFAFYTSAQAGVYLIPAVADERASIKLSFEEPAVELTTTNSGAFSGQAATSDPEVTAIEYSWDAEDAFGMLDEASGEVLLSGVEGSATITATFAGDENYKPASASYTISVIDASKSYYVKVTADQTDWSGEYLIVNETHNVAWNAALSDLDATPNTFEVTISGGKIERTDATMGKAFFIDPMEGGYSILASNGKYIGRSAGSNGLETGSQPLLNVITWNNHPVITGEGGKTIGFNSASNQLKFRYLGNSEIELYIFDDKREKCATPTFSVAAGEVEAGTVVTISSTTEGADIYYTTNGSNPTADSGIKGNSVTIDATTTLKAIAVKEGFRNSAVAEATYTVPTDANDGTLEHPYTPEEAKALAVAGDTKEYYIAGVVAKIQNQFNTSYGTANFWISVDGVAQDVFEGYKIKYLGNRNWVDGDQTLEVGDQVIIYGALKMYNTTAETDGGYLVSLNGITKALTAPSITVAGNNETKEVTVSWDAVTGATAYDVLVGEKSANDVTGTSAVFTMDDFGTYNVSVTAKASDAISATGTAVVSLVDESVIHDPVADGTVLFREGFDGFAADDVPAASNSSTVVYGGSELSYACTHGSTTNTRVREEFLAGGASPELLVAASVGSFTVNAIPTGWAKKMTLLYRSNKNDLSVTSSTAGVSLGTATLVDGQYMRIVETTGSMENFNLTFAAGKDNTRLDDIKIVAGEMTILTPPEVTATGNNDTKQVTVSWTAVTGATSYDVVCGDASQTGLTGNSATFTMNSYGIFSVSVTAKAENSFPATGSTTVTLTDPSGSTTTQTYVDILNYATIGVTGTTYTLKKDVAPSGENASSARYTTQSSGGNNAIQLRSNNSNSGIVSTTSGGVVKKVVVKWNSNTTSGRTIDIYGKASAYTSPSDLYNSSTQGTKIGSITYGSSTEITITGTYTHIGIRSSSGALYLDEVSITWEK